MKIAHCPNCKNRLEDTQDNQQLAILVCPNCGFTQHSENKEERQGEEQMQTPPAIKIVDPPASVDQNVQKSTIETVCPNCGNDKAVWAMVQTDRADEPSTH